MLKFPEFESTGSSKSFIKIGDGNHVIGMFKGTFETFYQKYEDSKYKIVPKSDPSGTFRFSVNFITKENGNFVAKIFQGSWHNLKDINDLQAVDGHDLEKIYVRISQTGERKNKRLTFAPYTKQAPDFEKIAKVELQDPKPRTPTNINYKGPETADAFDDSPMPSFDDETPF